MKRAFLNQDGESNKFWTIEMNGSSYTVWFGKVGTTGRENTKQFADEQTCTIEVEKIISDKQRKGYHELHEGQSIPQKLASYQPMNEEVFWDIIASFNWKKTGDDDAVLKPALKRLVSMSVDDIQEFAEILSEKLYHLDGIDYAANIGPDAYVDGGKHFSTDYFLYVRCCVVANGKDYYEHILKHPTDMPKEIDFEALLYLPDTAYNKKMKTEDENLFTKLSFETFSNVEAWQTK